MTPVNQQNISLGTAKYSVQLVSSMPDGEMTENYEEFRITNETQAPTTGIAKLYLYFAAKHRNKAKVIFGP